MHVYKFSPNPHDDPLYNKNQGKWYNEAATVIANETVQNGRQANGAQVDIHGTIYSLELN